MFGGGGQQQQQASPFGAKPAGQSPFGAKPAGQSPFGAKPAGQSPFGAKPAGQGAFGQQQQASPFGAKPAGQGAFGTSTAGQSPFGAKPAGQGAFGAKPSPFGGQTASAFGQKPAGGGLPGFSQTPGAFAQKPTAFAPTSSAFSRMPSVTPFQPATQQQPNVGMPQPQMQIPPQYRIFKFGDDRDYVIMKLNHLQALCGSGNYLVCEQPNQAWQKIPVEADNEYNMFKDVVYNLIPKSADSEGRIGLRVNGDIESIRGLKDEIGSHIKDNVLGLGAQYNVEVDTIRQMHDGCVEIIFQVLDTNTKKPLPASDVDAQLKKIYIEAAATPTSTSSFGKPGGLGGAFGTKTGGFGMSKGVGLGGNASMSNASAAKVQAMEQLGVETRYDASTQTFTKKDFYPIVSQTRERMEATLRHPPKGIPESMWKDARRSNPDPTQFVPVPIFGFEGLKRRADIQAEEQELHELKLSGDVQGSISQRISQLSDRQAEMRAQIETIMSTAVKQSHRVLRLMRLAAAKDRMGSIQDYKALQTRFEALDVDATSLYRGKLSEIHARVEMYGEELRSQNRSFVLANTTLEGIMHHLDMQQAGLERVSSVLQDDLHKVGVMEQGYFSRL
ncbi:hypothetical protein PTSG_09363 [Salpingoeca rosetta]|uniref:Nucleoporin Nup54 alpha-helical domain-containing protein n=1 Tax=Salpingoeca rosetta (strain ATCC 50818 / BSB-021) TaxID=946362 RepID=F2UME8_SALR5|nr:uncharacterized protein PTSG_09363 [Salpingoeca rosetta]EGD78297.1 hypothetical protein PTSG_09363 [Salpingoeca rosetta]|eukprot:XP_004989620.1 hypothetical protein PTSG_09363 [Salpingoeca rosetta]